MKAIRGLLSLLTPEERRRGLGVLVLMLATATVETAGVASVMPFLAVMASPDMIREQPLLAWGHGLIGRPETEVFLLWLGGLVFALIVFAAAVRTFTHLAVNRYVQMCRYSISLRLLSAYLHQPYEFFLDRHTGEMSASILSETDVVTNNTIQPFFRGVASFVVGLAIILLLLVVDPVVAGAVALVVGGTYWLLYRLVRKRLMRLGRERSQADRDRFRTANEAMAGIKAIKLLGRERAYLDGFDRAARCFAAHQATEQTLSQVPRYTIEAAGIGGVIVLALVLLGSSGGLGTVLPMLGLYAFAGYRLLPAAQNTYMGLTSLRFGASAIERIGHDLVAVPESADDQRKAFSLRECLEIEGLGYRYPGQGRLAIEGLDLRLPAGHCLGVIGTTGAGKSTLVDLLLGLLEPNSGRIRVDGRRLDEGNRRAWQRTIGYVPQDIFLADAPIRENIALGVPADAIDDEQVERCARLARLHDFVARELPRGYATPVGERGVRLSMGQRQRIGIARALYRDPSLLVLDEATSALDHHTEAEVMEAVEEIAGAKTIVMVAHRLGTVQSCDEILVLENGRVAERGTFEALRRQGRYVGAATPREGS